MVLFNYATKELTAKVVYYGPGLCGKTTNLQYIFDSLPTHAKGKMLSLATKTDRTLFFDFLPIDLGTIRGMKTKIQLYTVPGQVFYDTTRKLVLKGADGVVFVADSQRAMADANLDSFENLINNLKEQNFDLADMPHVIQFNKRDMKNIMAPEEMDEKLNRFSVPTFEAVAPEGEGVFETLKGISKLVLKNLSKKYGLEEDNKKSRGGAKTISARPAQAQPGAAQPSAARPAQARPAQARPAQAQPSAARPGAAQPAQAQPGAKTVSAKPAEKPAATPQPARPATPPAARSAEAQPSTARPGAARPAQASPAPARPAPPVSSSPPAKEIDFDEGIEIDEDPFGDDDFDASADDLDVGGFDDDDAGVPAKQGVFADDDEPAGIDGTLEPLSALDDSEVVELDELDDDPLEVEELEDMAEIASMAGSDNSLTRGDNGEPIQVPVSINLPSSLSGKPLLLQVKITFGD